MLYLAQLRKIVVSNNSDNQSACKIIINLLELIGMRGFMTILGIRSTPGSCEILPQKREELYKSFNTAFKVRYFNQKKDNPDSKSKITVGARALSKHSDRTQDKVLIF
jgi:hypothetical protein